MHSMGIWDTYLCTEEKLGGATQLGAVTQSEEDLVRRLELEMESVQDLETRSELETESVRDLVT